MKVQNLPWPLCVQSFPVNNQKMLHTICIRYHLNNFSDKIFLFVLGLKIKPLYIICIWPVYSKRIKPNIWTLKTFVSAKAKFSMKSKNRQMIPNLKQISRVFEATAKFSVKAKNRKMMSKLKGSRVASCCRRRLKCSWNFSNGALSCPPRPSASSR